MSRSKTIKRVFVCSPLRQRGRHSFEDNLKLVSDLCLAAVRAGVAPFAPHLFYTRFLDDRRESDRMAGIACGLAWLAQADEVWCWAESWDECSDGMKQEIEFSRRLSIVPNVVYMPKAWEGVYWKESLPEAPKRPAPVLEVEP